ncbi:ImmA/IrrE family metallo-endopeptidase [Lactobacillus kefiranofaciens subsp. kefirgranum]|uniref:ImmA/IrrE family metallo-endopeptidase n=1 Tax=Lactobacillus kefiranofaciens TaxID=267818 RepID=UPI00202F57BA|nr:ImmA/IrrE family metallo-endopeptidase [Lactobacillus kefiranofaciens]URW71705.1 ImmA/IrrE family metallo-endopeptidase [Lactobacillus kefiranofaciens subsp. kefirgranum]URW73653.1 ImmA/IrrE family metallo-endopeptidase [Lactobacillus kefiranofaciens subsp. kefirgranum]
MNAKWIYPAQIPFLLAHEIGHVLHENACFYHISDLTANKGEASENIFAIKLLQKYCVENEIYFDTWYKFAKCFGIPKECYYLLELIA